VSELLEHHRIDPGAATAIFKKRISFFLREGVPNKEVVLEFRDGKNMNRYTPAASVMTDKDGLVTADIALNPAKAPWLADSVGGWLTYHASVADGIASEGRVQLLAPQGLSVVSDIDDTIKITEIPAGAEIVALNTFFRAFASVDQPDNMAKMYNGTIPTPGRHALDARVSFHYVSGGPWQLYEPLSEYLIDQSHFPSGSFHLRSVDLAQSAHSEWKHLVELVENAFNLAQPAVSVQQNETYKHKIKVIQELMSALPGRKFVMFGDSGEFDPEVYEAILGKPEFRQMVTETTIRDVKGLAADDRRRLEMQGMQIIVRDVARPIKHGISQFGT